MQLPFDGHKRRRLYLVRHGEAAATSRQDGLYGDTISLTENGRNQATAMRDHLSSIEFDEAYSSNLNRARETAAIILESRDLDMKPSSRFAEMDGDLASVLGADLPPAEKQALFAYALWKAGEENARFFGGDLFEDYMQSAGRTLASLVKESEASSILVVSHSGFQRAALCWALDAAPLGLAAFEQDSCCLNILDIDVDAHGAIVRKHVRLANFTPLDPVKNDYRLTDGERLAVRLLDQLEGKG